LIQAVHGTTSTRPVPVGRTATAGTIRATPVRLSGCTRTVRRSYSCTRSCGIGRSEPAAPTDSRAVRRLPGGISSISALSGMRQAAAAAAGRCTGAGRPPRARRSSVGETYISHLASLASPEAPRRCVLPTPRPPVRLPPPPHILRVCCQSMLRADALAC
jgi:hypothetical protein